MNRDSTGPADDAGDVTQYREEFVPGEVRLFTLCPGVLRIGTRRSGRAAPRFELPLKWVSPEPGLRWRRNAYFRLGVGFVIFGFALTVAVCASLRHWLDAWNPHAAGWRSMLGSMGVTFAIAGLLLLARNLRAVEHATLRVGPLRIAIARAGPDEALFHRFVERVREQVRFVQGGHA